MKSRFLYSCSIMWIMSICAMLPSMVFAKKAVVLPLNDQMYVLPISPNVPTVVSRTGRIWMDRNLGATRVASNMTDSEAFGGLYQWGRLTDGHEKRNSPITTTTSSTDVPGHNHFITPPGSGNNWRVPRNDKLWQGENGINNPCPRGFRLPTLNEFVEEMNTWTRDNATGAFTSPLKLPFAGWRATHNNTIVLTTGVYWTSTIAPSYGVDLSQAIGFNKEAAFTGVGSRSSGFSVRCIGAP